MTQEVQCTFHTSLPADFKVPADAQINLATSSTAEELTQVVRQMLLESASASAKKELKTRKFSFVVQNVFLSGTLQNLIEDLGLSSESVLKIDYFFALDKPKPEKSIPQDEWISHLC